MAPAAGHRALALPERAGPTAGRRAYPFLAEAGLGSAGLLIGTDAWSGSSFCFDPWVLYERQTLTNLNMLLAGVIGKGKSALAKALATRSLALAGTSSVRRASFARKEATSNPERFTARARR